jgi:uncharacterized metal-binding protein
MGDGTDTAEKKGGGGFLTIALLTCSGLSNTGRLTTEAALTLVHRMPGRYVWLRACEPAASLEAGIGDAEQVIVIDGCTDCCAMKDYPCSCPAPARHIIATGIGIVKNGMAEVQFREIELLVAAIMDAQDPSA